MEYFKKEFIEEKFNALPAAFEAVEKEVREIEEQERALVRKKSQCYIEMFRLQGEHRLLKSLLESKE